jgi:spore coat protein CotH
VNFVKRHQFIVLLLIILALFVSKPIGSALLYYGHVITSGYGAARGFDAPYRRLANGVIESILAFRNNIVPERRIGLPQVRIYVSEQAKSKLLENIPDSISDWQKAQLLYPNNTLRPIKIRHRGDANEMNFVLSKKSWRIKTKKKRLFKNQRVINYIIPQTENMIEDVVVSKLATKIGVLTPKIQLVELFVNDKSQGVIYETEQLDEIFLRSNNIMPVNLYKGDTDRKIPQGLDINLFQSPSLWRKISINNRYNKSDRKDLERFFNLIRMASSSIDDYEALKIIAPQDIWARFTALQIMIQSWHNNTDHNQRLILDDQSGQVSPVLWDTGFSNTFQKGLHLNVDSQPLLSLYLRDSDFIIKQLQYLHKFIVQDHVLDFVNKFIEDTSKPFIISLQRDTGRSAIIPVSSTKDFLLRPRELPLKVQELKQKFSKIDRWLFEILTKNPLASWMPSNHGLTLFVEGGLPVGAVTLALAKDSKIPSHLFLDVNENGIMDNEETKIPFSLQERKIVIHAKWLANRVLKSVSPTNYGIFDLYENGLEIVPTAFKLRFDRAVRISRVTGQNALTKQAVFLKREKINAAGPSRLNRPVKSLADRPFEVWQGNIEISGTKVVNRPVQIKAGSIVKLAAGASLIFRNKLLVDGEKETPVQIISGSDKPWGTFALIGKKTSGSRIRNIFLKGGSGKLHKGINYLAMLSVHNTSDIIFSGLSLRNNYIEDDMMHIVYSTKIQLLDLDIKNAFSDGIDIDMSEVLISKGSIESTGNDCLDFMTSKIIVKNLVLSRCGDKGISIGEASQSLIINTRITNSKIGIESKDGSNVRVVHSDFLNNKTQINAYKKNWRYGSGGSAEIEKSYFNSNINLFKTDKKSHISIADSAIFKRFETGKNVEFFDTVDLTDTRAVRAKTYRINLKQQIDPELFERMKDRRGTALEQLGK